jgi:hypothetical protein
MLQYSSHHAFLQEFVLIKPAWMEGNSKLFSAEQMKVSLLHVLHAACDG